MAGPRHKPLIAIVGATGTGKSELAVALARRFGGEIINGDAMQLYEGLPIITNKIPVSDQQGIPHHLLGCIGLQEPTWVVKDFVHNALDIIANVHSRDKIPILVGGTNYYTQSLLFRERLADKDIDDTDVFMGKPEEFDTGKIDFADQPTSALLDELRKVDPVMADRWHPNDRRKIQRSLEIFLRTGTKASELYAEQRLRRSAQGLDDSSNETAKDEVAGNLRFPSLIFWVSADKDILRARLDARVDRMVYQGLLEEVATLFSSAQQLYKSDELLDESRGIWVSIGYKEFKQYSEALEGGVDSDQRLANLKEEAIEKMKAKTRQYAKQQVKWIRIKLVNAIGDTNASNHFFVLDSSDLADFGHSVISPASQITNAFLRNEGLPAPDSISAKAAELLRPLRDYDLATRPDQWINRVCEVCSVTCVTPDQWEQHTNSRTHRRRVSKGRLTSRARDRGDNEPTTPLQDTNINANALNNPTS